MPIDFARKLPKRGNPNRRVLSIKGSNETKDKIADCIKLISKSKSQPTRKGSGKVRPTTSFKKRQLFFYDKLSGFEQCGPESDYDVDRVGVEEKKVDHDAKLRKEDMLEDMDNGREYIEEHDANEESSMKDYKDSENEYDTKGSEDLATDAENTENFSLNCTLADSERVVNHQLSQIPATAKKKWPQKPCVYCRKCGVRRDTRYICTPCSVAVCIDCFTDYHSCKKIH